MDKDQVLFVVPNKFDLAPTVDKLFSQGMKPTAVKYVMESDEFYLRLEVIRTFEDASSKLCAARFRSVQFHPACVLSGNTLNYIMSRVCPRPETD